MLSDKLILISYKRVYCLQDQVLSSMQQKVDNLCEQLINSGEQKGTKAKRNVESPSKKFDDCDCWICDQHLEQFKVRIGIMTFAMQINDLLLSYDWTNFIFPLCVRTTLL